MTTVTLQNLVKTCYSLIKDNPDEYYSLVKEEAELFELEYQESDIYLLGGLIRGESSMKSSVSRLSMLSEEEIKSIISKEKSVITAVSKKKAAIKKSKAEKAKIIKEKEIKLKENEKQLKVKKDNEVKIISQGVAKGLTENDSSKGFQDYRVIARMGDDVERMNAPLKKALLKGWVPVGGISVTFNSSAGILLFCQAIALPSGKPKTDPGS